VDQEFGCELAANQHALNGVRVRGAQSVNAIDCVQDGWGRDTIAL
jgi:hypothetical protein